MDAVTSHSTRGVAGGVRVGNGLVFRTLELHAHRRRQGIATLSVLSVEGEDQGEGAWQRWVDAVGNGLRAVSVPWPRTAEDFRVLGCRAAPLWTPPPPEGGGNGGDALAVAVDLLAARLERGVPAGAWVCGLLVPAAGASAYLARAPESRAKAYFREGLIGGPIRGGGPASTDGPGPEAGPARAAAGRALRTASVSGRGVGPEALARVNDAAEVLDRALAVVSAGTEGDEDDGARSAAERFLFAMLEAMPGTAGSFALNAPLPGNVRFGPAPAEVDLLALGPRVAVEVDGYHHFTDAERYRRDRRKDALLQEQGFLVLRFLADDVVPRLETIIDAVRTAVARRSPPPS